MENTEYVSHAKTTKISATSRVAVKVRDNYYTVEYTEEREIASFEGLNMNAERVLLFDEVNAVVDGQVEDILKTFQK